MTYVLQSLALIELLIELLHYVLWTIKFILSYLITKLLNLLFLWTGQGEWADQLHFSLGLFMERSSMRSLAGVA